MTTRKACIKMTSRKTRKKMKARKTLKKMKAHLRHAKKTRAPTKQRQAR